MASRRRLAPVPVEHISRSILVLRGQRVILDSDLAVIYGVATGRLNEAVKRNAERFPEDFMFRLSAAEHAALLSQFAITTPVRGGRRQLPWAFTEHGAIQAANVLNLSARHCHGRLRRARLREAARAPRLEQGTRPPPR